MTLKVERTPERFAAEFEEAIANEEKLRSEGAQRELFTQLMAGEKTAITKEDLESLGITSVKLKKELPALNLADPQDARTAVETIVNYANNPTVKSRYSDSRNKVLGLLNMPILTRAETLAARENAQQEATEMTSEMDQISRGDAPGQVTIDEGIEQNVIDEQREAAFAGREQELADDTEALAATLNAAKSPDGIPTAMESAFDAAQNNNLDADISNEQRRIEAEAEARATTPQENDRVAAAKPTTRRRSANTQEKLQTRVLLKPKMTPQTHVTQQRKTLDQQRVDKELDEEKFRAEFTEVESGNDMESFLGTLAQQSIDGTPQQKIEANAKVAWIRQNASESINTDLEAAQNDVRSNLGLRLPAKKLVGGAAVLDPEVTQLLPGTVNSRSVRSFK